MFLAKTDDKNVSPTPHTSVNPYERTTMKKIIIAAIILIVLLNSTLIVDALIKSHKAEQREQTLFEINQHEALQHEARMIETLQDVSDHYEELQNELIYQTVEENYDYYVSFSKKCLVEFEKHGYNENLEINDHFSLYTIINDNLKNEVNGD
jgi:hypothetical protein